MEQIVVRKPALEVLGSGCVTAEAFCADFSTINSVEVGKSVVVLMNAEHLFASSVICVLSHPKKEFL